MKFFFAFLVALSVKHMCCAMPDPKIKIDIDVNVNVNYNDADVQVGSDNYNISKPVIGDDNYCDCDYHLVPSGCKVSVAAPNYKACNCDNYTGVKCSGNVVVPCRWPERDSCANPGTDKESCQQGGENSNCGGY